MQELRDSVPQALPIVLTSFDDDEALAEALAAGARAYLLKTVHGAEISDVVRAVASGRVLLDERTVTRRRADHDDPTADLTNAERKVLDLIGDGCPTGRSVRGSESPRRRSRTTSPPCWPRWGCSGVPRSPPGSPASGPRAGATADGSS